MRIKFTLLFLCILIGAKSFAFAPPPAPTVTGTSSVCLLNPATMIASITPDDPNVVFRWFNTGSALDLVPVYTGDTFTTAPLLASRSYFVESYNTLTTQKSSRVEFAITVQTLNLDVPVGTAADPIICAGDSTTLTATSPLGAHTFRWYTAAVGGTLLHVGPTYNTGALSTTTTFYLESELCVALLSARTPVLVTVLTNVDVPVATPADPVICSGGSTTITATSITGNTIFKWYDAATGGNLLHTGATYATGPITSNLTVYVATETASGCASVRTPALVTVINNVDVPVATPADAAVCSGGSTTITASSLTGNTIFKWYDAATAGTLLFTGNPYSTGALTNTTTVYVAAEDASGCSSVRTPAIVAVINNVDVPVATPADAAVCSGGSTTITATSLTGNTIFKWYDAATAGNLLYTGNPYATGALTSTTTVYVAAEDASGCASVRTAAIVAVVNNLDVPVATPTDALICSGDSTTITASSLGGNTIFKWYDAITAGNLLFTGNPFHTGALSAPTTYYVESVDATGCASVRTPAIVAVTVNLDVPVATPTDPAICSGQSTSITGSSVNGSTVFNWYDAASDGNLLFTGNPFNTGALTATTTFYLSTADANGCNSLRTPAIVAVIYNLDIPVAVAANPTPCYGDSTTITATSVAGNTIFKWYDAATGGTLLFTGNPFQTGALSSSTTFYVASEDATGCASVRTAAVIAPLPAANPPTVTPPAALICSGQSTSFTANTLLAGAVTYRWYDAITNGTLLFVGQTFNTGSLSNNGTSDAIITYYVEVEDATGCISTRTPAIVTIRPALDVAIVNPPVTTICSGDSVILTGTSVLGSGVTYSWYDAGVAGNLLYTGNPYHTGALSNSGASDLSRIFYVEIEDTAGCKSARTPAIIVIRPALNLPIVNPPAAAVCAGGSTTFTASNALGAPGTYRWYDAATGGTLLFTGAVFNTGAISNNGGSDLVQNYYVEFEDTAGCKSFRNVASVVVHPALALPLVNPLTALICNGDSASFTASMALGSAATYNWYDSLTNGTLLYSGNPFNTGAINNTGAVELTRVFYVEAIDTAGCISLRSPATVIVRPALDAALITPPATLICSGDSATLVGSSALGSAVSYNWYDTLSAGTKLFTGNPFNTGAIAASGGEIIKTYYLEIEDTAGCKSLRTPATVTVRPAIDAATVVPPTSLICSGDSAVLTATSVLGTAVSYNWYDALSGGTLLYTGNPYHTGAISNTGASDAAHTYYVELVDTAGCKSVRTPVAVVVRPALDAPLVVPPTALICSGDSASFTASSLLGSAATYNWYGAATAGTLLFTGNPFNTGAINNTGAADLNRTYFVEVVDTGGCLSLRTPAAVIVRPALDAPLVVPPTTLICSGDSASLTATSVLGTAVTYNWYDAASAGTLLFTGNPFNTGAISNAAAADLNRTYYVEIVDTAGCKSLRTPAVVIVRPATDVPVVVPPTALVCSGDSASFTASSVLGTAVNYSWYDAATAGTLLYTGNPFHTGAINNTGAADLNRTYYVELTDTGGCKSVRTLAVVIVRPALDAPLVVPPTTLICSGDSASLTATSVLGTGVTFNWYDAATAGTLLFSGNPFNTGAIDNSGAADLTRTYYVEVVDTAGCKSLRTPGVVIVRPAVDVPVVNPPVAALCSGDSATFTATSVLGTAVTYNWYDAATAGTLVFTGNPFHTGAITNTGAADVNRTYYVELIDTGGCKSVRTPAVVLIRPALDAPLVVPPSKVICSGQSTSFTASSALGSAATYNWYDALTGGTLLFTGNPFHTGAINNAGATDLNRTYYVELVDTAGCKSIRTPAVVIVRPALDAAVVNPAVSPICSGNSANFTATSVLGSSVNYNWYDAIAAGTLLYTGNPYTTGTVSNTGGADITRTYYVELVDTVGCKSVRTPAVLIVRPALDIPIVVPPVTLICNGYSATLTASSALGSAVTYTWYDAATGGNLLYTGNPFNTGKISNNGAAELTRTYYVSMTDTGGCISVRTPAAVVVRPALDAALVDSLPTILCSGDSASIHATSLLGSSVNYNWYDALTGGTLLYTGNPFNTGAIDNTSGTQVLNTYYVELVDTAGCTSLRTPAVVVVRPALDVALVNPPVTTICSGDSVILTATSVLGTAATYSWYDALVGGNLLYTGNPYSTGAMSNSASDTLVYTYYVALTDSTGCMSPRTPGVVVVRPAIDVPVATPPVNLICSGNSAIFGGSSLLGITATYNWYDSLIAGNLIFSGDTFTTPVINNASGIEVTQIYYLESVDSSGCRSLRTPATVVVRPALDVPLVDSIAAIICNGDSVTLTASSLLGTAVTYNWYDSLLATTPLYTGNPYHTGAIVNASGAQLVKTYFVELVDTAGCKSLRTPSAVVIRPALDVPLVDSIASILCSGDSVTLTASSLLGSAVNYNWYDSLLATTPLYTGNPYHTGPIINANGIQLLKTYFVELIDTAGCKSLRTPAAVVVRPALDVPLVDPLASVICSGDSLTLTASSLLGTAVTYNWYDSLLASTPLFTGNPFHSGAIINANGLELTKTYFVELVDTGGCRSLRTPAVVVVRPALDVPLVDPLASVICSGDSLTLTASSLLNTSVNYNWYDSLLGTTPLYTGNPFRTGAIVNSDATDLTRLYYVELIDTAGCKSLRTPATVVIRPALDVPVVIPPVQSICSGFTAEYAANSLLGTKATYAWYDSLLAGNKVGEGQIFTTPVLYNTKIYYVELTDSAGCKSVRTPVVTLVTPNLDQPEAHGDSIVCYGMNATITATSLADTNYNWYTSSMGGTAIFTGEVFQSGAITTDTVFYVEGVSAIGCLSMRTAFAIRSVQNATMTAANVDCSNASDSVITFHWNAVQYASSYQVSTDGGMSWTSPSAGAAATEHSVRKKDPTKKEVSILVKAITKMPCVSPSTTVSMGRTCYFISGEDLTIFYNSFSPNGDGMNDVWQITNGVENYPDNQVFVFDRWGREIYRQTGYDPNDPNKCFKGRDLDDGSYFFIFRIPSKQLEKTGYVMIIR